MPFLICGVGFIISIIVCIISDCRRTSQQPPNGKKFKEKFITMVKQIYSAQIDSKTPYLAVTTPNGYRFDVKVVKESLVNGVKCSESPYKSYGIYIDEQLVCRVHILTDRSTLHTHIEFTMNRYIEEIIEIVSIADKQADKIIEEYYHNKFHKNSLVTSFYIVNNKIQ